MSAIALPAQGRELPGAPAAAMLRVSVGQHSDRGRKAVNQDFHGARVPRPPLLGSKGVAVALADGIGSSEVSQVASEFAVMGLLDDYYCTPDAWSVRKSVERVLAATNSWLHARTQQGPGRYDKDRGHICTLSALVLKSATAHVFHVGDARIHRLQGRALEQLTQDHRTQVSSQESYLSRAMGLDVRIDIDYLALPLERGDVFVLSTDGVHEHVDTPFMCQALLRAEGDLDAAARTIVDEALRRGSPDNLTVQIVAVVELPLHDAAEAQLRLARLPAPPLLQAGMTLDRYRIVRELHASARSHVYLAEDTDTGTTVVLKTPATELQHDAEALDRFHMEEWVARRIDNAHVLKAVPPSSERRHLYVAMEYVDGQTLAQWMLDHPQPALETVRSIVEQIAKGLRAFHRQEMLHQDLRPANIMIDRSGSVKIIDFGATHVAGIAEMGAPGRAEPILGTEQYSAPEYFLGEAGSCRSDLFSLAVITYQLLSGRLPYGTAVASARTRAAQARLRYRSVLDDRREIPSWIDAVLAKALHPNPLKRQDSLSEFTHDLRHPSPDLLTRGRSPLAQRHPLLFWKGLSALLGIAVLGLFFIVAGRM